MFLQSQSDRKLKEIIYTSVEIACMKQIIAVTLYAGIKCYGEGKRGEDLCTSSISEQATITKETGYSRGFQVMDTVYWEGC